MPVIPGRKQEVDGKQGDVTPLRPLQLNFTSPSVANTGQVGTLCLGPKGQTQQHGSIEEAVVSALNRQADFMDKILNKPAEGRRGVIRIEPKVQWPVLNNDDLEVEEFYEEFENICGLANDMKGLNPMERLLALKTTLRGSRAEIYDNVRKYCTEDGSFAKDPDKVYELIKNKLLTFRKTYEEKQTTALAEWTNLYKANLTALEFETRWEKVINKLKRYGLERQPQELLLGYYCKINSLTAKEIKKDRRIYQNADGSETVRQCITWDEAHDRAIEIEEDNAATKAITNPNYYTSLYYHDAYYGEDRGRAPKGEGKSGKKAERPKGVCFDFMQYGKCEREGCRYSHEKKAAAAAKEEKGKKGAAVAAVEVEDPEWAAKAYQKGKKGKGKGKGKDSKDGQSSWPGKGKYPDQASKKHILCKYVKKRRSMSRSRERLPILS
jgi:hypothetical protein